MRLEIPDSQTGLIRVVYDCTTGIYPIGQLNHELPILTRDIKSRNKVVCIPKSTEWMNSIESLIKRHVAEDLPVDYRPDGYRCVSPKKSTEMEIGGVVSLRDNKLSEESYSTESYRSANTVVLRQRATVEDSFKSEDKLILWHTHPSCDPVSYEDLKAFLHVSELFETLKPENCFDVRYIPKMNTFYWFNTRKKSLREKIISIKNRIIKYEQPVALNQQYALRRSQLF